MNVFHSCRETPAERLVRVGGPAKPFLGDYTHPLWLAAGLLFLVASILLGGLMLLGAVWELGSAIGG